MTTRIKVLSHNKIETMPSLPTLKDLTKLSVAHNRIRLVPDLSGNEVLRELRLNDNKITTLPDTLRRCSSLEILDLGNNLLKEWRYRKQSVNKGVVFCMLKFYHFSDVAPLGSLLKLTNLNLKGNPVASKEGYREKVRIVDYSCFMFS